MTLTSILKLQYPLFVKIRAHELGLNEDQLKRMVQNADCVRGHFLFEFHQFISRPCTYITMLRDPIERVISLFYFIRRRAKDPLYERIKDISLDEFVNSDSLMKHEEFSNRQLQSVCGGKLLDLDKAKENINNFFSVVGITERFDESVFLMQKELGWSNINYKAKNVNTNRPPKEHCSKEVINKIAQYNEMDIELYNYGKQLFEMKLKAIDP